MQWPWRLFILADHREESAQSAMTVAYDFLKERECCLPPGFARRLAAKVHVACPVHVDAVSLMCSDRLRYALRGAGWGLKLSIVTVERLHSVNRARASTHAKMGWQAFAAKAVLAEARAHASALRAVQKRKQEAARKQAERQRLQERERDQPDPLCGCRLLLRKQTPFELFRKDYLADQAALGRRLNVVKEEVRQECRLAFEQLSEGWVSHYHEASAASAAASRIARAQRRAGPLLASPPAAAADAVVLASTAIMVPPEHQPAELLAEYLGPPTDPAHDEEDPLPLHPGFIADYFKKEKGRYTSCSGGVHAAVAKWKHATEHVKVDADFPATVVYPRHCGAVCKVNHGVFHMQRTLRDAWNKMAKHLCKVHQVGTSGSSRL